MIVLSLSGNSMAGTAVVAEISASLAVGSVRIVSSGSADEKVSAAIASLEIEIINATTSAFLLIIFFMV
jgi:hypothetical protein